MRKTADQILSFDSFRVRPLPDQPRKRFSGIKELSDSIAEVGQMQPGIVTLIEGDPKFDAQLIDGERRLRACQMSGTPFLAIVKPAGSAEDAFVSSFAANFGKQDHDVIEIAEGLQRMRKAGKTVDQLAKITGRTAPWVYTHLALLDLHPDVRAMMVPNDQDSPRLTFSLGQLLTPLSAEDQIALATKIIKGGGMGLAAARRMVLKFRAKSGDKDAYGGTSKHKRSIETIETILETITDRLGVYIDMPGAELAQMVDRIDNAAKRNLIRCIEDVSETLVCLGEAIGSRLPKVKSAGSRQ